TTQQTVSAGSKAKFGLISENFAADSSFVDWNVDVVWSLETVSELDSLVRPYLFRDGNANVHFISVADSVGGSISPRSLSLTEGETRVYKIKADNGYQIVDVFVDSVSQGALSEYTFVEVSSAHSISASFEKIPYEITVNVGSHGEVDSSSTTIFYDEVKTFKFTADEGYEVHSVYVNGEDLGVISEYTFQDIFTDQTLEVFFIKSGLAVATEPAIGTGTDSDPYQISNLSELRWLSEGLETGMSDSVRWSKHYLVTENIDASETFHWNLEEGFSSIGTDKIPFTGSLNGQGFKIDSLTINRSEGKQIGLFGFVSDAHIHQLGLKDISLLGKSSVGGLAGKAVGSIIERVYVSGDLESTEKSIGGLIGEIGKNTFVHRSFSLANVTGIRNVGGLLGACYNSSVLESYAVGK
ncbi:M26 family metallopeptidase, partial [Sediminitomix flava]|uniref:hypothetical protein n=1 Tax=Sediminitomix flava TaxID=379075 RepID=UPI001B879831